MDVRPFWLAGKAATGDSEITVTNPYDGSVVGAAAVPTPDQVEQAVAAEEARRWSGETQRLDTDPGGTGRMAYIARVPKGPVLAVTPFNFPLNLTAHKVAPAIAVGAPIVVKPAPATPLSALLLGELLAEPA